MQAEATSAPPPETPPTSDLRRKTTRGALHAGTGQAINLVLRTGSMMALARIVPPADFGLVAMATAVTGLFGLLKDVGLGGAAVQREHVSEEELSTLFWINVALGTVLAVACAASAPFLSAFYKDSRLFWITIALGVGFFFTGTLTQHRARLVRDLRFASLTIIETGALVLSIVIAVGMGIAGFGYWALVVMTVSVPALTTIGLFVATRWIPRRPAFTSGVREMLRYGGTVTVNTIVVYLAYNLDKVLLGRFAGAEALGFYSRAYQLVMLPMENLNSTIGGVAFPALCRVQSDAARLRNYFLKGYKLFLSVILPIMAACALFAEDIVKVFLGPRWTDSIEVFRLLTPAIVAMAFINPFAWLMLSTGRAVRSLNIAFMIAPVIIIGYWLGLKGGPTGVALGYSIAMTLIIIPMIAWAKHGTLVSGLDVIQTAAIPGVPTLAATAVWFLFHAAVPIPGPALLRLCCDSAVLFGAYGFFLLFVMKQKSVYSQLLRDLRGAR